VRWEVAEQKNVQPLLDYCRATAAARQDLAEVIRLHGDPDSRWREQAGEMGRLSPAAIDGAELKIEEPLPQVDLFGFLGRNVRPAGGCHAALHLNLRCVAQNCHVNAVTCGCRKAVAVP
jgi:hypothetical protein